MVAEAGKLEVLNFSAVGITEKADCSPIKLGSNRTAVEFAASHGREPAVSEVEGTLAPPKKMTEAAKIYWVAGMAHTRRIFSFRDSSKARLSSLMRLMSLLESCSLEANSQRTRHFSGSCLSFIGLPLLKWQDQVRHCETRHVSCRVERWAAVFELAVHQQFES
jgi:hypothetical protein